MRARSNVWIISNIQKLSKKRKQEKKTNIEFSNADAYKCKFDCDVLVPPVIAVLKRLFPVSAERHHPARQKGPRVINAHERGCI